MFEGDGKQVASSDWQFRELIQFDQDVLCAFMLGNNDETKMEGTKSGNDSLATAADGGLLSISPRQYREYAAEWKSLAASADSDQQQALFLKMASIWLHAAIQFEAGSTTVGSESQSKNLTDVSDRPLCGWQAVAAPL